VPFEKEKEKNHITVEYKNQAIQFLLG